MPSNLPKYSRPLARTRTLLGVTMVVVCVNASLLAFLVDSAWEAVWGLAVAVALGLLVWMALRRFEQVAKEVRAKEDQLSIVFDSVPIGLYWSYHREGENPGVEDRIFNPAHSKITGLTKEEMDTPGAFAAITHPDDREAQKKVREQLSQGGLKEASMEKRYLRKNGDVIWVKTSWKRVYDEDGKGYKEINSIVDITDQKKSAGELERAREAAEEASRSKSLFLASMSHEIRTPMNGMIGMLHLMESNLDDENLKYLEIAQNSANDLLALINDILDFSKIEAGKMELQFRDVALDELLERVCETHASTAFGKGLDMRCFIEPGALVNIHTDPHKLRQVLSNLVSNAIKFTDGGEVVLGARRSASSDSSPVLEIYVEDTGIGLDSAEQERLFQPFTQANATTTRKYGGTGLGLSICKSIVDGLGGEIGAESQEGHGSSFWIRFPFGEWESLVHLSSPFPKVARPSALVVDRSLAYANDITNWLSHWGCRSVAATSLADARDQMPSDEPYELIVLDTASYEADEKGWREAIGDRTMFASSRVIFVQKLSNERLFEVPDWVSVKLSKPVKIQQLHSAVRAELEGAGLNAGSPPQGQEKRINFSGASVLVVEDNITNRMIVTKLLKMKFCIDADFSENGLEALEHVRKKRYDIVFMDCMMPEMDGFEATRAIRGGLAGTENMKIPIVALTANAMEEDREKCASAGMDDHLSKPISVDQIREKLQKWIH